MIKADYDVIDEKEEKLTAEFDKSKLFGSPCLPKGYEDKFKDSIFFLGQINLSELASFKTPLPKKGMLYFFLDMITYPIRAKVFYRNEEADHVIDGFNEGFGNLLSEPENAFYLHFKEGEGSIELLSDVHEGEIDGYNAKGEIALLKIDSLEESKLFPTLDKPDDVYYFLIKKTDLEKGLFEKTHLVASGS